MTRPVFNTAPTIRQLLPGLFHWRTFHEGIGEWVHSHYVMNEDSSFLLDPRVPDEGLEWFAHRPRPRHAYLTNRLHDRHSDRFEKAFSVTVWCHLEGLYHFDERRHVRGFSHGDELPGGIRALAVGALCPEETAFYWTAHGGVLALGDAIIRVEEALCFVPDSLMGDDPAAVRRGIRAALGRCLELELDHLLFAHGEPWIGGAKRALGSFLESAAD